LFKGSAERGSGVGGQADGRATCGYRKLSTTILRCLLPVQDKPTGRESARGRGLAAVDQERTQPRAPMGHSGLCSTSVRPIDGWADGWSPAERPPSPRTRTARQTPRGFHHCEQGPSPARCVQPAGTPAPTACYIPPPPITMAANPSAERGRDDVRISAPFSVTRIMSSTNTLIPVSWL